ncbi:hypothetical protein PWT90_07619 [Aphanocladium album]|nr:hypothetical protein PWT90_07619 [Aphanocladium album]
MARHYRRSHAGRRHILLLNEAESVERGAFGSSAVGAIGVAETGLAELILVGIALFGSPSGYAATVMRQGWTWTGFLPKGRDSSD